MVGYLILYILIGLVVAAFCRWFIFRGGVIGADIFDCVIDRWLIFLSLTVWPFLLILLLFSWGKEVVSSNVRR